MLTALPRCCAEPKASGFSIDSLTKPITPKKKTRVSSRWRASRETE
jgi:hypothetical protein